MASAREITSGIESDCQNFEKQYQRGKSFSRIFFRPGHFQKGHLVLRKRKCNVHSEIISPQLEFYLPKFKERDIEIDESLGGVPEEDFTLMVDKGLISRYMRIFSPTP